MPSVLAKYLTTVLTTRSCLTPPWNSGAESAKAKCRRKEKRKSSFPCYLKHLWMLGGKAASKQTQRQEGNQPSSQAALTDAEVKGKAQGNSTESIKAGKQFPAFQAALLLAQPSHAPSSSAPGSIIPSPCSSWAILRFLIPEAVSRSSFLKLKEHWEYLWTFKSLFSDSSNSSLQLCLLKVSPEMQENKACSGNC